MKIAIIIPSIESRLEYLKRAISTLNKQDADIYYLTDSAVTLSLGSGTEHLQSVRLGPIKRYEFILDSKLYTKYDYIFTCDDDLLYPIDYIRTTISILQNEKKIRKNFQISYHTSIWPKKRPVYQERKVLRYHEKNNKNIFMPFAGSGVSCFTQDFLKQLSTINIPKDIFEFNDDIWISAAANSLGYTFLRPITEKCWIDYQKPEPPNNLFQLEAAAGFKSRDELLSIAVQKYGLNLSGERL